MLLILVGVGDYSAQYCTYYNHTIVDFRDYHHSIVDAELLLGPESVIIEMWILNLLQTSVNIRVA